MLNDYFVQVARVFRRFFARQAGVFLQLAEADAPQGNPRDSAEDAGTANAENAADDGADAAATSATFFPRLVVTDCHRLWLLLLNGVRMLLLTRVRFLLLLLTRVRLLLLLLMLRGSISGWWCLRFLILQQVLRLLVLHPLPVKHFLIYVFISLKCGC